MSKKQEIEDLKGRGMTARVTDTGQLFSTYSDFARDAGYPDAAEIGLDGSKKARGLDDRVDDEFVVISRGKHGGCYGGMLVYVIESEDSERFLVGEDGLDIKEPEHVSDLTEMDRHELTELIKKATDELLARSFVDGFETGVDHADWIELMEKSPQAQRDSIVERAKGDMSGLIPDDPLFKGKYYLTNGRMICDVEFVINREKRTVVALMRGHSSGYIHSKGIAKCAPTDCFNVHIGKAIALRRALGEEVPDEYLNAPQPTEVRVGDVVTERLFDETFKVVDKEDDDIYTGECHVTSAAATYHGTIIDDSREEESE